MNKKSITLIFLSVAILLLSAACKNGVGSGNDIKGEWQLKQYCFGNDCTSLEDYGMEQTWIFADSGMGRQVQPGSMDNEILWSLSASGDTLFTSRPDGGSADTLFVSYFVDDTLELSSMLKNILVRLRFVRP